MAYGMGLIYTI